MLIIAKRSILAAFTEAKNIEGLRSCELDRRKFSALMRSITEGLCFRQSAAAVFILFSNFKSHSI